LLDEEDIMNDNLQAPALAPTHCPDCGGELSIERDVLIEESYLTGYMLRGADLPRRTRIAYAAAFCSGCEFAVELDAQGRTR
jgi:hypothetical protein